MSCYLAYRLKIHTEVLYLSRKTGTNFYYHFKLIKKQRSAKNASLLCKMHQRPLTVFCFLVVLIATNTFASLPGECDYCTRCFAGDELKVM